MAIRFQNGLGFVISKNCSGEQPTCPADKFVIVHNSKLAIKFYYAFIKITLYCDYFATSSARLGFVIVIFKGLI